MKEREGGRRREEEREGRRVSEGEEGGREGEIRQDEVKHLVFLFHFAGNILHPFTWTVGKSKQPFMAVLFSWFIVQV